MVIEGTWEEIKSHDVELAGRRVRLLVEPSTIPDDKSTTLPNSVHDVAHLEELLEEGLDSGPMTPMTAADWDDVRREGRNLTSEQMAAQAMLTGLRGQRTPQTLAELPQNPLPDGKTLLDLFQEFWREHPSTETDEQVVAALKALR